MNFSEFAQTLSKFYMGENTQYSFTKELLLNVTDDEDAVLKRKSKGKIIERSEKTFTSYYTGEREIRPIAIKIHDKLNTEKFIKFLRRIEFNNINKNELCNSFIESFPNMTINENNLFSIITDIYVDIIKKSCTSNNEKREMQLTDNSNITKIDALQRLDEINKTKEFFSEIGKTLYALIKTGRKIANKTPKILRDFKFSPNITRKLENEYDKLQNLYDLIETYNKEQKDDLLNKALILISKISIDAFIETEDEFIISSINNYPIHDLLDLIQENQQK